MRRKITQRELRNDSGRVMRALDKGDCFIVTRNGVAVGELIPHRQRQFVPTESVRAALASAPAIDPKKFREDIDAFVDQDPAPRA